MKKAGIIVAVIVGFVAIGAIANLANPKKEAEAKETVQEDIPAVANVEPTQTEVPKSSTMQGEGAIDDAYIKIVSARKTVDYEDKPAIIVSYEFTNNGSGAASFMFSVNPKAFQNGIECSTGIPAFGDNSYSSDNQLKDIKKGATLTVDVMYKLNDETSDVEIEVGKIFDFADPPTLVVKTFTLQ